MIFLKGSGNMAKMRSFSGSMGSTLRALAGSDDAARKAMRAARVKQMWSEVVDPVFLDHTNSVYIIREGERKILIVYVDESIFAAELNARRELIKLKFLERFNERLDEFRILVSRGRYKNNYIYRKDEGEPSYVENVPSVPLPAEKLAEIEQAVAQIPDEKVRKSLQKAMISDLEWKMGIEVKNGKHQAL